MSCNRKVQRQTALLGILILLAVAVSIFSVQPVAGAADFVMAYYDTSITGAYFVSGVYLANDTGDASVGNNFNVDTSGYVTQISVDLMSVGSPVGYIGMMIFSQNYGIDYPYNSSSVWLETSTDVYPLASMPAVQTEYTFTFNQTTLLSAGNFYSFMVYTKNATIIDGTNRWRVWYRGSGSTYGAYYYYWDNPDTQFNYSSGGATLKFEVMANVESASAGSSSEEYWWSDETVGTFAELIVMIVIVLIPSALLGKVFKLGFYGYIIGMCIGAAMGYLFFPSIVPIWLVFAIIVGLAALIIFGKRGG